MACSRIGFGELKYFMPSKASESALQVIMKGLETSGLNIIGLHGMPGSGKTALVIQVRDQAKRQKLFDEFVEVTVSENIEKIQDQIAEQLHLKFGGHNRARTLMSRLQDKDKRKLIVLDDVREKLKLNKIGIPVCDYCKVLLTTRQLRICQAMDCQPIVLLDLLTDEEAWTLFKLMASLEDESSPLMDVARKVSKECQCLPISIVLVAYALKGKPPNSWELALHKLNTYKYPDIQDVDELESSYKSIQLSFDFLQWERTRRCLLLCSLFPEDHDIFVEDLTRFAVGLGLFQGTVSIKDSELELLDALNELLESHLLLETGTEGHVKMRDLVRAASLCIGRSYSGFKVICRTGLDEWPADEDFTECAAISLPNNKIMELPEKLIYPGLEMLLLGYTRHVRQQCTEALDASFQDLSKLRVLSLACVALSIESLESLTNLRTLELKHCSFSSKGKRKKGDLASLQKLQQLEILSFHGSDIWEFPVEIGELKNLKLLDLTDCFLDRIPENVIGKLSKLEELLVPGFENWDFKVEREGNPSLMELNSLQHLAILSLTSRENIPEDFVFSSNLIGYDIHVYCDCESPRFKSRLRHPAIRAICTCPAECGIKACKGLIKNVYDLRLGYNNKGYKNMIPEMFDSGFEHLSSLNVDGCDLECLICATKCQMIEKIALPNLVELIICNSNMREICDGLPPEGFLKKLQEFQVLGCDEMITLFPTKLLRSLQALEHLTVEDCENLQELFELETCDESNKDWLSHLKTLELSNLEALTCIWKGSMSCVNLQSLFLLEVFYCKNLTFLLPPPIARDLMQLEQLEVRGCDQLEHIIAEKDAFAETHPHKVSTKSEKLRAADIEEMEILLESPFKPIFFSSLKKMQIEECHRLRFFLPIEVARGLPLLTKLHITKCNQLETIFRNGDQSDLNNMEEIVLPKLLNLYLEDLPSLVSFCPRDYHFIFPSLEHLRVKICPKMTTRFTAAPEGSIHIKPTETRMEHTTMDSAATEVVLVPQFPENDSDWSRTQGKWFPKEDEE